MFRSRLSAVYAIAKSIFRAQRKSSFLRTRRQSMCRSSQLAEAGLVLRVMEWMHHVLFVSQTESAHAIKTRKTELI